MSSGGGIKWGEAVTYVEETPTHVVDVEEKRQPKKRSASVPPTMTRRPSKKWKHAGRPGSVATGIVNFASDNIAFPKDAIPKKSLESKAEVLRSLQPKSLTGGPERWNYASAPPNTYDYRRGRRAMISEYQGPRMVYNYRAEKLPSILKDTVFLPKPDKFHFDQRKLLSKRDKKKLADRNVKINTTVEIDTHPKLTEKQYWNTTMIINKRDFERKLNETLNKSLENSKKRNQALKSHKGPMELERERMRRIREAKMEERKKKQEEEERKRAMDRFKDFY